MVIIKRGYGLTQASVPKDVTASQVYGTALARLVPVAEHSNTRTPLDKMNAVHLQSYIENCEDNGLAAMFEEQC